mmetsp:Transcript_76652/g.236803  ORF Transcript_76652/g.236803 Transcript_76652/m.236803 type:complete len:615 (+) Transcript_76652:2-1846(+)
MGARWARGWVLGQAPALLAPPREPPASGRDRGQWRSSTPEGSGHAAAFAAAAAAAAALPLCRGARRIHGGARGPRAAARGSLARRADVGGGVDYAIIRFKVPGFDDLTMLPRVIAAVGIVLLVVNRVFFPDAGGTQTRLITEALALVLSVGCWTLPWVARRLDEAARRQVSTRQASTQLGCLQTLAIEEALPLEARLDVAWATSVLLRLTNADGLAVWRGDSSGGAVVCTRGLLRQLPGFSEGAAAVLRALGGAWAPAAAAGVDGYCATRGGLGAFPAGALPSAVLPGDAESAVAKPMPGGGLLVLWSALPRAFDRSADRQWVARAAAKLGAALPPPSAEPAAPPSGGERCFEEGLPLLGRDEEAAEAQSRDPFARFDSQIRIAPALVGLLGLGVLGWNRTVLVNSILMEIDPAQSRADLLGGVMAVTLLLQGMVWLSETPASPEIEDTSEWTDAEDVMHVSGGLPGAMADELRWAWGTLSACTRVCSMVVFWQDACVMQAGLLQPASTGGAEPTPGALCREVMSTGKGRYLAQLKNYPAKEQFLGFLPSRTQGLVLTPLRPARDAPAKGVIVLGVDSIRGVGKVDQAWIGALAEKLAVGLDACLREATVEAAA